MKSFLKGGFGALLVLILAALLVPQYSDYQTRVETQAIIDELAPLQRAMESRAAAQYPASKIGSELTRPSFKSRITFFQLRDSGEITVKGGSEGQMLVLSPTVSGGKITWHCMGGSDKDMPILCRNSSP